MTLIHFNLGSLPYHDKSKGTHIIHCWIAKSEPTHTDSPGDERRAIRDAEKILSDLLRENITSDDEMLLCDGDIPAEAIPVFTFAIGVCWDRENGMASYKRFEYETLCDDAKFTPVLALGRELYDYTFGVLRKRENDLRKGKYKWDGITVSHGREMFSEYCRHLKRRHEVYETNRSRFDCPNLRSGLCSPMNPKCANYCNGRCVEVEE